MNTPKTGLVTYLENEETKQRMVQTIADNIRFIKQIHSREALLDYAVSIYNWFFRECVLYNQYRTFSEKQYFTIQKMYEQLVFDLKKSAQTATGSDDIERIVTKHRELLLAALDETADADNRRGDIQRICSEYSTDLQRSILGYHFDDLAEPILDIGCGEGAHFVTEGLQRGKRIVGIDQYISKEYSDTILCRNWLEFEYIPGYWGTIVSHMAFTNHFIYHLKHKTALVEAYDETYFNILLSLRSGGTWYYSPSIPEIEEKIETCTYGVRHIAETLNGIRVSATQITKL